MRYKDIRQLQSYLKQNPVTMSSDQLNHYDALLRFLLYEISCLINNFQDRQLLNSLYLMNVERFTPKTLELSR